MLTIQYRVNPFLFFLFMLMLPFICHGQARDKKKTVDLLCHKWESNVEKSPQKMDCFPADAGSSIQFLTNGYIIFTEKKGVEGVWNYDAARNNLYIIVNGSLWKYSIKSITATELSVENTLNKTTTIRHLQRNNQ